MRKTMILAAFAAAAALSACSKSGTEPAATATSDAAVAAASDAAGAAAEAAPKPGAYAVSSADGKQVGTTTINADGTYTDDDGKGHRVAGLVKVTDGKTCFDPSGKAEAVCYTESAPAADGSFTATDPKGAVLTVKPVAK